MKMLWMVFCFGAGYALASTGAVSVVWIICVMLFGAYGLFQSNVFYGYAGSGLIILGLAFLSWPAPQQDLMSKKVWASAVVCGPVSGTEHYWQANVCLKGVHKNGSWQNTHQVVRTKFYTYQAPLKGTKIHTLIRLKKQDNQNSVLGWTGKDDDWVYTYPLGERYGDVAVKSRLSVDAFQIYQAMTTGNASFLNLDLKEQLVKLGIIHLFVFSGFHVGVIFGLFYMFFCIVTAGMRHLVRRKKFNLMCAWISTSLFLGFGLSFNMPSFRAWLFLGMYIASQLFGFSTSLAKTLIITFFLCLLITPQHTFSLSAYLSFLAVIGIVWSLYLTQYDGHSRMIKWIKNNFVISMGAYLWTTPILIYFFSQWHTLTYLNNMLLVPTFGVVLVGLSLLLKLCAIAKLGFLTQPLAGLFDLAVELFTVCIDGFTQVQPESLLVELKLGHLVFIYLGLALVYTFFHYKKASPTQA